MRLDAAEAVRDATLDEVVAELVDIRERLKATQEAEYLLCRQIIEAMEDDGSERMRTEAGIVTISRSVTYDPSILARLREITDPADLEGIYTPEREVLRLEPERWDMTRGRRLVKHSSDHAAIIADAKIYGRPKVKIEKEAN